MIYCPCVWMKFQNMYVPKVIYVPKKYWFLKGCPPSISISFHTVNCFDFKDIKLLV